MAFNVNLFQGAMKLGGARPSLFQVNITNPVNSVGDIQVPFMVKATQVPASTLTPVLVKYFGRDVKFAGNRTYEDWTCTILNDEDFAVRNGLEEWSNAINSQSGNMSEFDSTSPVMYKSNAQVTQFSKTGVPLRVYNLVGIFPTMVGPIEMAWENSEAISEFEVTFSLDYVEVSGGITGRAGS